MNKSRRAEIAAVIERLRPLLDEIESIRDDVEQIRDDEQEYFDNMPEAFQYADRGQAAEQAIGELDEAFSALSDFDVDAIIGSLETAAE